jgi:hypothetical protein
VSELEKFRDYWTSQPGQKGTKTDWQATWRNWIRNAKPASSGSHLSFRERDHIAAVERAKETGGGFAHAKSPTIEQLNEVFDVNARLLG